MQFRHDRRRRVLTDESASTSDEEVASRSSGSSGGSGSARRYAAAAQHDHSRRIVDLIPSRALSWSLVALGSLLAVAALVLIDLSIHSWHKAPSLGEISALDLTSKQSLARWFCSLVLGLCAVGGMYVYMLRRHRVDDYHGRYRVWLWFALLTLFASVDQTTGCHELGHVVTTAALQWANVQSPIPWAWSAVCGGLGLILFVRMLFEMRRCPRAVASLVTSAIALTTAILAATENLPAQVNVSPLLLFVGGQLVAALCLLATVLIYGRHVCSISKADYRRRRAKSKKRSRAAAVEKEESRADHGSDRRAASQERTQADEDVYSMEDDSDRSMSRAERKRMRREMRRQQRAA